MKRSEINEYLNWAEQFLSKNNIRLPELAYWSPSQLRERSQLLATVKRLELGWDITDFGSGNFKKTGAVLYTVRNGLTSDPTVGVPYCEKYILMREGQHLPNHYHISKTEDIINRAGGEITIQLWNVDPASGQLQDTPVTVYTDGWAHTIDAAEEIQIPTGCSITLRPYVAHIFGPRIGTGDVVIGEVSKVNDDHTDNFFLDPIARFATIEEDTEPSHLLCNEYSRIDN